MGRETVVSVLLEHGADVDARRGNNGLTPLHNACTNGNLAIATMLLQHGGAVNSQSNMGRTCLHRACQSGRLDIVSFLLANDADASVRDNDGATPLHKASFRGHHLVVALLLPNNDVDINAQSSDGSTPLHQACEQGHANVVLLLIQNGARMDIQDNAGNIPLIRGRMHFDVSFTLLQDGGYFPWMRRGRQ